jgi:hypothetical protein
MFEKAARLKLRFDSPAGGQLSVEDLWDLPLTSSAVTRKVPNLDDLAIQLDKQLKETTTTSFVKKSSKTNEVTKLKFDVVLKVIEVKQAEAELAETKRSNAEKKQKLLEIVARKQDAALEGKSLEELQKELEAL